VAAARQHPSVPRELSAGHVNGNLGAVSVAAAVDGDRAHTVGLVWGRSCSGASRVGTSDRGPGSSQFGPRDGTSGQHDLGWFDVQAQAHVQRFAQVRRS
jgi:hypothetical protein